jgi:serine/threonine-protein kinase
MIDNPYSPPKATLDAPVASIAVPDEIVKKIRNCWIAGVVSIVLTVALTLVSIFVTNVLGLNEWAFVDVAIMMGLTFGVYRKSRVCAFLLLAFFALNKVLMWVQAGNVAGLPLALVFFWFYFQGVVGTVQYHRLKKQQALV